jgi:predicted amidohydrolase
MIMTSKPNTTKLILVQPELSYAPGMGNLTTLMQLLDAHKSALAPGDIVLLPEHTVIESSRDLYVHGMCELARQLGCHVVGGSHHQARGATKVNAGAVCDARGQVIAEYEKLRPYASERQRVEEGSLLGELNIGELRVLILICADFWFSDVFVRAKALPDLVLVPAHSVSRKPEPNYSRSLWRHLSVARAYEFGVYVGVSDWAHVRVPGMLAPSGVAGFADPTTLLDGDLFRPLSDHNVQSFELDLNKLQAFRADRRARGFFWKTP